MKLIIIDPTRIKKERKSKKNIQRLKNDKLNCHEEQVFIRKTFQIKVEQRKQKTVADPETYKEKKTRSQSYTKIFS
jgi:hypothetical protein